MPIKSAVMVSKEEVSVSTAKTLQLSIFLAQAFKSFSVKTTWYSFFDLGVAGPRACQDLILAAKTHAALSGKYSPDIEDVKAVATPVLRHRLLKNYKAEAEGKSIDALIQALL